MNRNIAIIVLVIVIAIGGYFFVYKTDNSQAIDSSLTFDEVLELSDKAVKDLPESVKYNVKFYLDMDVDDFQEDPTFEPISFDAKITANAEVGVDFKEEVFSNYYVKINVDEFDIDYEIFPIRFDIKDVSGELRAVDGGYYAILNSLVVSPLDFTKLTGQWVGLAPDDLDLGPEYFKDVTESFERTFIQTGGYESRELVTLVKDLGLDLVNDRKAFHYKIRLANNENTEKYLNDILSPELKFSLDESIDYSKVALIDVWIDARTFRPVKYYFDLNIPEIIDGASGEYTIELVIDAFDEDLEIKAPESWAHAADFLEEHFGVPKSETYLEIERLKNDLKNR